MTLNKHLNRFFSFAALTVTAFLMCTLGNTSTHSEDYKVSLNLSPFYGLSVSAPTHIDENVYSQLHTQPVTFTLTPAITESITIRATILNPQQCTSTNLQTTLIPDGNGAMQGSINFTATNDGIIENSTVNVCHVTYTTTSTNLLYNNQTFTTDISIIDWNPNLIIENIKQIDENPISPMHTNTIKLTLSSKPSDSVTYNVSYDQKQIGLSTTTIYFDINNWNTGVFLVTTALYDKIEEPTPHYTNLTFTPTQESAIEYRTIQYPAVVPIADYTVTIPTIVRTGAYQILPPLSLISFFLILFTLVKQSQKSDTPNS